MKGLTGKQKNIVEFIDEFHKTMEMAPTIYEIAEHFGIKTSTVFAHIRALQRKGILHRSSKARSISLDQSKKKWKHLIGVQSVPIMETGTKQDVLCDTRLFRHGIGEKGVFALRVKGTDMTGPGILEGDLLLLKSPVNCTTISAGDLLVTEQNGKTALCSCVKNENGNCELASGKKHHFTVKQKDLPLKGIVIGLQRCL